MKKSNQTEIMEVDAEEMPQETALDKVIETSLVKANITDRVLAELKEKYKDVRLKSLEDKESFLECKAASKEIRKVEIAIEKLCERGRSEAVAIQRKWIAKQKSLLATTGETKNPIDEDIKRFEDELERKEIEEKIQREEVFMWRQACLLKCGATYNNGSFELGHISYEIELIKNADSEMFEEVILPKYRKVYEEKEADRVAEEAKRKEENDRLKAEQEKFAEQQRLFKEQQEEFAKQQKALQEHKDAADREARALQQKKEDEERELAQMKLSRRSSLLRNLCAPFDYRDMGLTYAGNHIEESILDIPDGEWDSNFDSYKILVEAAKKEIEDKRIAKAEKEKQDAIAKALADQKAAEDKKKKDLEEQKQQEIIRQQAELEASNDRAKYENVIDYLLKTPIHTMKSSIYKSKMGIIADFIDSLKN
jgi:hypothetical protein